MNRKVSFIALLYLLFSVSGSLYATGEKTISVKGESIWKMTDYRTGITEMSLVRPTPVVVLSSVPKPSPILDLSLSFDEGNPVHFRDSADHYKLIVSPLLEIVGNQYARTGSGAALFPGAVMADSEHEKVNTNTPLVVEVRSSAALFAPNNRIYDFSVEFWLNPLNLENGEQIVNWTSVRSPKNGGSHYTSQRILCTSSKNRLQWSFQNFFCSPDDNGAITINIGGTSAVVPKTWSHHLIRFDSMTGMIEYVVNGKAEAIEYATSTGREGGEVYTPIAGEGGSFVLGGSFSGLMDEFKIHGTHLPASAVRKYPTQGGRIETRAFDLGDGSNGILKLEAFGGKVSVMNAKINSEYRQNGRFRFSDDSEMQFFIRCSDNPYRWDNYWQPVTPGADLAGTLEGRYVQLAVDFYPSANGETSPYLEELRIIYMPDVPPLPPAQLTAVAMDGAVQLRWKNSPDQSAQGYLVYYGTSSDDYFGEDAIMGVSPIDAGKQNAIYIDGLKNGTLYYFRVAAYKKPSHAAPVHVGEFSREVRARPLR